jgi:hypothetical protein
VKRPALFYTLLTVLLFIAATVSEYVAETSSPSKAALKVVFTCVWPVVFYLAATYSDTPWVNSIILGLVFVGITPTVFDNTTHGWEHHPTVALAIGAVSVALMAATLIYSVVLSLQQKGVDDRKEAP